MIDSVAPQQIKTYLQALQKKAKTERAMLFLTKALYGVAFLLWGLFLGGLSIPFLFALLLPGITSLWGFCKKVPLVVCAYRVDRDFDLHERVLSSLSFLEASARTPMQSALLEDTAHHLMQVDPRYWKANPKSLGNAALVYLGSILFLFLFFQEVDPKTEPSVPIRDESVFLALQESATLLEKAGEKGLAQKMRKILETPQTVISPRFLQELHTLTQEIKNLLENLRPVSRNLDLSNPNSLASSPASKTSPPSPSAKKPQNKELLQRSLRSLQSVLRSVESTLAPASGTSFSHPGSLAPPSPTSSFLSPQAGHPKIFPQEKLEKAKTAFSRSEHSPSKTWMQAWWPQKYSQNIEDYFRKKE